MDIININADFMDGRSFLGLLHDNKNNVGWRRDFLISYHGEGDPACGMAECPPPPPEEYHGTDMPDAFNNTYHCVYSIMVTTSTAQNKSIYCRFDDDENFVEYYNLVADPWQTHNAASELTSDARFALEARLAQLRNCKGETCRRELFRL